MWFQSLGDNNNTTLCLCAGYLMAILHPLLKKATISTTPSEYSQYS